MLPASEYSFDLWKYTSTNWSSSRSANRVSWRLAAITISLLTILILPSRLPFTQAGFTAGAPAAESGVGCWRDGSGNLAGFAGPGVEPLCALAYAPAGRCSNRLATRVPPAEGQNGPSGWG